jgi:PD-(D/E)XK nuclease superfamily
MERYETVGVEVEFAAPLLDPDTMIESDDWYLRGKIDALAIDRSTGELLIVEHKTSSADISPGSDYWRRLRLDSQISMYYDGARALGYEPTGIVYDVLAKPNLRLGGATKKRAQAETLEEFRERFSATIAENPNAIYARSRLVRFDHEIDEARRDVWATARQLDQAMRLGEHPRNPGACWKYGSMCEFFPVCSGEATLDDTTLFARRAGHSELSATDDTRPALTNSRISLARECQRAHLYRYVEGYETTARSSTWASSTGGQPTETGLRPRSRRCARATSSRST